MKKIFLLLTIFSLAFNALHSQSFTLSSPEGPIPANGIVGFLEPPSVEEMHAYIFVTNNSAEERQLLVKREDIYLLPNTFSSFCWNQSCYPSFVYEATDPIALAPGATTTSLDFYGLYSPEGQQGTSKVRFTFFDANNINDSASVVVYYITGFVGTGNLLASQHAVISKPYPNPASSVVSFNIAFKSQIENAVIVVRNMLGSIVQQYPIHEKVGTISLPINDLKEGIYFYTLFVNDYLQVETGRLIIRR